MAGRVAASSSLFFTELVVIAAVIVSFCAVVDATTDPNDVSERDNGKEKLLKKRYWKLEKSGDDILVSSLMCSRPQVLYTSLNSPSQLTGWKSSGGDPCGESWRESPVKAHKKLFLILEQSDIRIGTQWNYGILAQQPCVTQDIAINFLMLLLSWCRNLAGNNLSGNLPYSVANMGSLIIYTMGMHLPMVQLPLLHHILHLLLIVLAIIEGMVLHVIVLGSNVPSDSHDENKNGLTAGAIVGIVLGSVFAVLLLLALVCCLRRGNKKEIAARPSTGSLPVSSVKEDMEMQEQRSKPTASVSDLKPPPAENVTVERLQGKNGSLKRVKSPITATSYTVAALQTATNSFSQENLVGEGSLGRVYKAEFPNGKIMAIKKVDNAAVSLQEEDNFLEAISSMARLRHPNIVALVGYCAEHGQRLLVHDYIGNGSLHDMLHFADERSKMLTWNARVRVALGTARALEYLHEVCLPSVVHRNLKSANILLDEELNPHLSDCGLAALTPNTERQISSTQMIGSFGYSAPEFALSGIYTVKSDVYSFGVVMLELLTGRKPLDSSRVRSEQSLVRWATPQLHDIDALAKMVDPTLNGMYPAKSLSRFADIIALCVQPEPEFRPPMSEVVQALVRLMQRASIVKRRSSEESGFAFKTPDHEASDML
ncbi:hypothetical protein DH2020_008876 [Rehmannia glutinosa]|uniref:Protein kinase domain-containing protein n=1 Tax=Rehmannia glutinosa TaxID=99300 RepID=A0ABR0X4N5_REHGL